MADSRDDGKSSVWGQASDAYGWSAVLRNVLPYLILLAIAPRLAQLAGDWVWLLAAPIGLFAYRITIVMHDCTHRTLFRSRRTNVRIGVLLAALSGIDFESFTRQHWRHHRAYGESSDPQGFHYLDLGSLTRFGLLLRFLRPLWGGNLRYALPESLLAPRNLTRAITNGRIWLVIGVQLAIAVLVTNAGRHLHLIVLPFLSSATFGLFFSQLRGVAEHGCKERTGAGFVRSHAPHWLDRLLLYDLNFNYHEEHHRFPHYPSRWLPEVHRCTPPRAPLARTMFATLRYLLVTAEDIPEKSRRANTAPATGHTDRKPYRSG